MIHRERIPLSLNMTRWKRISQPLNLIHWKRIPWPLNWTHGKVRASEVKLSKGILRLKILLRIEKSEIVKRRQRTERGWNRALERWEWRCHFSLDRKARYRPFFVLLFVFFGQINAVVPSNRTHGDHIFHCEVALLQDIVDEVVSEE